MEALRKEIQEEQRRAEGELETEQAQLTQQHAEGHTNTQHTLKTHAAQTQRAVVYFIYLTNTIIDQTSFIGLPILRIIMSNYIQLSMINYGL